MTDVDPKKYKVLVVEDSPTFRAYALQALEGHEAHVAETVQVAIEKFKNIRPDITLLDIELPDGVGFDVLKAIRIIDKEAYVVMMTTHKEADSVMKAKSYNVAGYIVKPFNMQKVKQCIDRYAIMQAEKEKNK